jgi:hypothetical protein
MKVGQSLIAILFFLNVFVLSPLGSHEPHAYEHTENTDQKMGNN